MAPQGDKKEAILEAMLDLVVERGFHNAPMSLLAKRNWRDVSVSTDFVP
jgi:AcrR family transcriptional regulator